MGGRLTRGVEESEEGESANMKNQEDAGAVKSPLPHVNTRLLSAMYHFQGVEVPYCVILQAAATR